MKLEELEEDWDLPTMFGWDLIDTGDEYAWFSYNDTVTIIVDKTVTDKKLLAMGVVLSSLDKVPDNIRLTADGMLIDGTFYNAGDLSQIVNGVPLHKCKGIGPLNIRM